MLSKRDNRFSAPFGIVLLISTVLTMTMSQAPNAQEPVRIIRFENLRNDANFLITENGNVIDVNGNPVSAGAPVLPSTHHCVATGWSAAWDINEDNDARQNVWTQVRDTDPGALTVLRWFVRVSFNNDGDRAERPDVDVVCFPTSIATFSPEGKRFLYDPD